MIEKTIGLLLRTLIQLYRYSLSYFLGRQCRFLPTCSAYADEAIRLHGPIKGSKMAVKRFCRCHPWGNGGFDPVPPHVK
jgi:putative membrane protein insertion efficiency factor